jgi:hypothetical protein
MQQAVVESPIVERFSERTRYWLDRFGRPEVGLSVTSVTALDEPCLEAGRWSHVVEGGETTHHAIELEVIDGEISAQRLEEISLEVAFSGVWVGAAARHGVTDEELEPLFADVAEFVVHCLLHC